MAMHHGPIYISSANTQPINVWIKILSSIITFRGLTEIPLMVPQSGLRTLFHLKNIQLLTAETLEEQ